MQSIVGADQRIRPQICSKQQIIDERADTRMNKCFKFRIRSTSWSSGVQELQELQTIVLKAL